MAGVYDKGQLVRVSVTFQDTTGAYVDPTTVVLTVIDPAGTTTTPSVTKDSLGHYHADVNANLSGTWKYRFTGTGTNQGADEDYFTVNQSSF